MLLAGDVALHSGDSFTFKDFPTSFLQASLCINLEGAIVNDVEEMPKSGVFNSAKALESLKYFNFSHPFVANNHIHDLPNGLLKTQQFFQDKNLNLVGDTVSDKPVLFKTEQFEYAVLGFGWSVIGCKTSVKNGGGVNPFNRQNVLRQVKQAHQNHSDARIVVVVHGNYEFEPYPQPGHRKLAKDLVDLGVYAVIFHHPHIVGPIERYKNRTIAYSLGNFAFSFGKFFDGKLIFPERSFHQIVIELGEEDKVHHCNFLPPRTVQYSHCEEVLSSSMTLKAEFEGYSDKEYLAWFKKNRHKRKLLPIYKSADVSVVNFMKDRFVLLRQKIIEFLVSANFKSLKRR